jgi:hypothetical protein
LRTTGLGDCLQFAGSYSPFSSTKHAVSFLSKVWGLCEVVPIVTLWIHRQWWSIREGAIIDLSCVPNAALRHRGPEVLFEKGEEEKKGPGHTVSTARRFLGKGWLWGLGPNNSQLFVVDAGHWHIQTPCQPAPE